MTIQTAPDQARSASAPRVLLLGVGNLLLQDEGLGLRALERLAERYCLPPEIQALDGGTLGLDLLPYLEGVTHLLVVDAVQTGQAPGTLVRLEGNEVPVALSMKVSMHQVGLQELLAASHLLGSTPPHIVLWGIEPAGFEVSLELSETVTAKLEALVEAVAGELRSWSVGPPLRYAL